SVAAAAVRRDRFEAQLFAADFVRLAENVVVENLYLAVVARAIVLDIPRLQPMVHACCPSRHPHRGVERAQVIAADVRANRLCRGLPVRAVVWREKLDLVVVRVRVTALLAQVANRVGNKATVFGLPRDAGNFAGCGVSAFPAEPLWLSARKTTNVVVTLVAA